MRLQRLRVVLVLVGTLCFVALAALAAPASAASSVSISVKARVRWTPSGVVVSAGSTISMTASGTVYFNRRHTLAASPTGRPCKPPPHKRGPYLATGLPCYSLVAKVGASGGPFEVGTNYSGVVVGNGELELSPNDNYFPDNSGAWTVVITVSTSSTTTTSTTSTTYITSIASTTTTTTTAPRTSPSSGKSGSSSTPAAPSGVLAFTGLGPLGQALALFGFLLVVLGVALYFLSGKCRRVMRRLLGL